MPSSHGQNTSIMEKQKSANTVASTPLSGESNTFICTVCGDGFSQYPNVLTHMAVHGPLESFSFDGSSNGFEVPREYILQENGTLTVLDGLVQSHSYVKPLSPGILPSHFSSPFRSISPTLKSQPSTNKDVFRPRPSDFNSDKSRLSHYRCEICNRVFNSLQSLHRHQQYRNPERGFKCTLCCKIFQGRQDLVKHLQEHAHQRFHSCCYCGKRFLKVDALNAHQKENHLSPKTVSSKSEHKPEKKIEKTYSCKKCKLHFFWMSDFQAHSLYYCKGIEPKAPFMPEIEIDSVSTNMEDPLVGNCYSNGTSLDVTHEDTKIFRNSSGVLEADYTFTPYRCGLCGDRFQNLTTLKEHHLTHQTQEEIDKLNEESQITFKQKTSPKGRRRRSKPNGKLHPCKHCHRVFNHSSSLSRHMRYHKGTMHTCVFCGRRFPQRCDLRRHIAMYHKAELEKKPSLKLLFTAPQNGPVPDLLNGEKNTDAPVEKTKSSSDSEVAAYPEGHLNEKQSGKAGRVNYKCQECGKRFGLLCVYQRHLRYHKKEPIKCPRCPAQFKNDSSLELHLQNHPSNEETCDVGQSCHSAVSMGGNTLEKCSAVNTGDAYMDCTGNVQGNSSEDLYECTECTETFSHLEMFLQHQTTHSSDNNV